MRDIAIVSYAQTPYLRTERDRNEVEEVLSQSKARITFFRI